MMRSTSFLVLGFSVLFGCAGDDSTDTAAGTDTAGTDATSSTGSTSDASDSVGTTTGSGTTTGTTTTSATGTAGSTGGSTTDATGTAGSTGGSTTGGLDCENLPMGPFMPEQFTDILDGSEDFAFDGLGNLAGKNGDEMWLVDSAEQSSVLASLPGQAYGTRFNVDGDLLAALPGGGRIAIITPAGDVSEYLGGLSTPNGIFPDLDGNVWVTEFGGSRVTRINPDKSTDTIVMGNQASSANGVVYDPDRGFVFYTNYQSGRVAKVSIDQAGDPGVPVEVGTINGRPDGLVLDGCGNLYVVDQQNSDLYRFWLDENADAVGNVELVAEYNTNVANAQFGRGDGFDTQSIYAAGNPGTVWVISVGVTGAAIP